MTEVNIGRCVEADPGAAVLLIVPIGTSAGKNHGHPRWEPNCPRNSGGYLSVSRLARSHPGACTGCRDVHDHREMEVGPFVNPRSLMLFQL